MWVWASSWIIVHDIRVETAGSRHGSWSSKLTTHILKLQAESREKTGNRESLNPQSLPLQWCISFRKAVLPKSPQTVSITRVLKHVSLYSTSSFKLRQHAWQCSARFPHLKSLVQGRALSVIKVNLLRAYANIIKILLTAILRGWP